MQSFENQLSFNPLLPDCVRECGVCALDGAWRNAASIRGLFHVHQHMSLCSLVWCDAAPWGRRGSQLVPAFISRPAPQRAASKNVPSDGGAERANTHTRFSEDGWRLLSCLLVCQLIFLCTMPPLPGSLSPEL